MSTTTVDAQVSDLLRRMENNFSTTEVLSDRWELIVLTALCASNEPQLSKDLYLYLIAKPEYSTSDARKGLIRRLREVLVKTIAIVGVCKPIESILAIDGVERPEDKDLSCSREGWQCDEANLKRGNDWMSKIYVKDMDNTMDLFSSHKDFEWVSRHISYGLYLGDRQNLDDIDTEMVVLVGIMMQNLNLETQWHLRGSRRLGIPKADMHVLYDSVMDIAERLGMKLDRLPTVDQIEPKI